MKGSHLANVVRMASGRGLTRDGGGSSFGVTAKLWQAEIVRWSYFVCKRVQGPHAGEALTDGWR
jgi:hypothetical protein